jgi:hypothetical protein
VVSESFNYITCLKTYRYFYAYIMLQFKKVNTFLRKICHEDTSAAKPLKCKNQISKFKVTNQSLKIENHHNPQILIEPQRTQRAQSILFLSQQLKAKSYV